jgi:hypothetical protein
MSAPEIIITVQGGLITSIEGIPLGVKVTVRDYDIQDAEDYKEDDLCELYHEETWS